MVNKNLSILCTLAIISFTANAQDILNETVPIVINPGQQTPEANLEHQKFCQSLGEVDITNEAKITTTSGAQDAILCSVPLDKPLQAGIIPLDKNGNLGNFVPNPDNTPSENTKVTSSPPGLVSLIAPSGTLPFRTTGIVIGVAEYKAPFPIWIRTTVSVPADNCTATAEKMLNYTEYSREQLNVPCTAWVVGGVQSKAEGCSGMPNSFTCQTAIGTINQPQ